MRDLALGIDVGTSGVRVAALAADGTVVAKAATAMPAPRRSDGLVRQRPAIWRAAIAEVVGRLGGTIDLACVRAVATAATSGTILGLDAADRPIGDALMYNDASGARFAPAIDAVAPGETAARGAMSGLARALFLQFARHPVRLVHQADWLNGLLTGEPGISDESHALKTGYDPVIRRWPDWIAATGLAIDLLPRVVPCGAVLGEAAGAFARELGLAEDTLVVAGCTDGCASFLATGASRPGDAVSSLGSTLTVKILSDGPVFAPEMGIYSHRIGDLWLAGGASNAGGAAIAAIFSPVDLQRLEAALRPSEDTGQDFYPLVGRGERFPVSDPALAARLTPRPEDDVRYLQGLYEGLARIEAAGYAALATAGAARPLRLFAVGGGTKSAAFQAIRARLVGLPTVPAAHGDAAVGVARLALRHL
ncbi:FGGY-family carbohydrate kinase [Aureimonas glaciei]|uniref:Carbohydrate kinase n=1 Tax=Aureimonas glaciei TaxID=1776957 RepID=A0A916XU26_9HYPH|nr:FGGY-family carbohydrate kinase [Aureimonas glaciei]GGD10206.1 carbohydrate kinase [Aureimonas glaciei]